MAIDTPEKRASTCSLLQPWVLPGIRAGSTGPGWRPTSAHTYAEVTTAPFVYLTLDTWGTPRLTTSQPAGTGASGPMTLRDVEGGQPWDVAPVASLLAGLLTVGLTASAGVAPISAAPVLLCDPHITAQYIVLVDTGGVPWYIFPAHGALTVSPTAPADADNVTPAGGPYTWWAWRTRKGEAHAISVTPEGTLRQASTPPAGAGCGTPQALGDADGHLWHCGVAPDGSLGMTDWPPIDYSQAATCLVVNDDRDGRWYWRIDPQTRELVCSTALEPGVLPWQAQGELGFLSADDPEGGLRWYCMAAPSHEAEVRHAPNLAQPWGMAAPDCPLVTADGHPWLLRVDVSGSLCALEQPVPDIPFATPILYAREAVEALRHVEAAGAIVTLWAV